MPKLDAQQSRLLDQLDAHNESALPWVLANCRGTSTKVPDRR
jgi:hypothetical protein